MSGTGGPITVLIVDDQRMFAESLARVLEADEGIARARVALDARSALEEIALQVPTVVLIDYHMPMLSGAQLAAEIKARAPEVPIIMVTGNNDDRVLIEAIDAGCTGFVTKDRAATEVAAAVRHAAMGEAVISPEVLTRLLPKLGRQAPPAPELLTPRERELLRHFADGKSTRAAAEAMHLSVNTARNYAQSILTKLGAHSRLEAVALAVRQKLIDYPGE